MSSPEFVNQQASTSSCHQQWGSNFEYNYTPSTSPVMESLDQPPPDQAQPIDFSNWDPGNNFDLNLGFTVELSTRCSNFSIENLILQNDSPPAEVATPNTSEQQQVIPIDAPTNLADATLNATLIETPPTAKYVLSKEPINDDNTIPVFVVKKAKEPLRPCRVRIKEGKAPRHVCYVAGCDKDFSRKEHLDRHLMTHLEAKPYVCRWPNCEQRFTRKETLKRHQMRHSDEKQLVCDVCGKKFRRDDCLKRHLKVHERFGMRTEMRERWRERKEKKSDDDSCTVGEN